MNAPVNDWLSALANREFPSDIPQLRAHLLALFGDPGVNAQQLAVVALASLKASPSLAFLFQPSISADDAGRQLAFEPLLHRALRAGLCCDLEYEASLTRLRSECLERAFGCPTLPVDLATMVTIAIQCHKNEYVWARQAEDEAAIEQLARHLIELPEVSTPVDAWRLACYSAYKSMRTLGVPPPKVARALHSELEPLIHQQVTEAQVEEAEGSSIKHRGHRATKPDGVAAQYEQSPYPRWSQIPEIQPQSFASFIRQRFPFLPPEAVREPSDALVAGCGTGRQAIALALRHPALRITAIDVSRPSLAYALRLSKKYGVTNVEYIQCDLREVESLGRNFDVIECVGVLHHLEDPSEGLAALLNHLRPDGWMRLGLYSSRGRRHLLAAQAVAKLRQPLHSPDELRLVRQEIIADLPKTGASPAQSVDFYSMSGFRDLLCNARETSFTPSDMADLLARHNLEFLGFTSMKKDAREQYSLQHPDDPYARDLQLIDAFEDERGAIFSGLPEFWIRSKPSNFPPRRC